MTATLYPTSITTTPRGVESVHDRPNYALRRAVAALLAVTLAAVAVVSSAALLGAAFDFGGRPAAASEIETPGAGATTAPVVRIHVAEPGDSLWSIADSYRGDVGRDRFVDALIELNGGTEIQVGQAVHLP